VPALPSQPSCRACRRCAWLDALPPPVTATWQVHPSHVFAAKPEARELFASPLSFAYTSHAGPVYAARFSPFHRNVFLTASTDGLVRLYNQLQPAPFHTIEPSSAPLLTAAWSPARPLVFAAGSADGALYIYDLKKSKGRPQVTLTVTSGGAVTWVAFNPKSGDLLATADAQGFVKIWRLSTFLTEPAVHELETLDAMATAGMAAQGDDDDADAPAERAGP
jgi:WD40 repeat protein